MLRLIRSAGMLQCSGELGRSRLWLLWLLASGCAADEEMHFRVLLQEQAARYPVLTAQDVYKFVYQAALGSGHAVQDTAYARARLIQEIRLLEPRPNESLYEFIRPDSTLMRVNLRPYLAAGHDSHQLLNAFIATSLVFEYAISDLERYWSIARRAARAERFPLAPWKWIRSLRYKPPKVIQWYTTPASMRPPTSPHTG